MSAQLWPDSLLDMIFIPHIGDSLEELADLAESEEWNYQQTESEHPKPILYNYLYYTDGRLAEQGKIAVSDDAQLVAFNTGLVTPNQEPLYVCESQSLGRRSAALALSMVSARPI